MYFLIHKAYYSTNLVHKQGVESQSEGHDKQCKHHEELYEGVQDIFKHHDIDTEPWELLYEQHEVDPTQEDCHHTEVPLPFLGNIQNHEVKH